MSTRHIYEMQVKTANYEAMMQRFQLRKTSDTGLAVSKFQAENIVIDKESASVKKKNRHQTARFSLQRMMRSLTRWKTWKKFFHSLGSPINPSSRAATLHGIVMLCTYHFQLFYLPFGPSYYPNGSAGIKGVNIALELIFLMHLLLNLNTAYQDQGTLVTSRRLIARHYLNKWFILDFLSATPRCGFMYLITGSLSNNTPLITHSETVLMVLRVLRITLLERAILLSRVVRISKHMVAWLRYSRYSHLLGIAQLMWLVLLIAHYMACLWHVVSENHGPYAKPVLEKYIADYYYAVSLIQGQGNFVGTRDENLYSTVAILVGSVVLAIVFGNVAMLVSNFNASSTNYHRKMEAVFATMDKMKLPDKLRDRIHQYYTHVWTEYESLDDDIVRFQRELTHTLGLEVGLYKYMNLVTEIPFWKDCSPDFATQIVLSLAVRVYLPDDYVVRKGETCDEMFMINRGICALSYTWDSDSESEGDNRDTDFGSAASSTRVASLEVSRFAFSNQLRGSAKFKLPSDTKTTSMDDSSSHVRPQQYRLPGDALKALPTTATDRSTETSENCETQLMYPGETTGEMGLIMNHSQPGSIRAVTYVEMCILDRATFQRIISRYPKDRRTVLTHMLRDSIEKGQFPFSWDEISDVVLNQRQRRGDLGATPANIHSTLTPAQAAQALVERLDVELPDKTIKFGLQGTDKPLELQLPPVQVTLPDKTAAIRTTQTLQSLTGAKDEKSRDELLTLMRAMTEVINRVEYDLKSVKDRLDHFPYISADAPSTSSPSMTRTSASDPPTVARKAASAVSRPPPAIKRLNRVKSSLDVSAMRNRDTNLYLISGQQAIIKPKRNCSAEGARKDDVQTTAVTYPPTVVTHTPSRAIRLEPICAAPTPVKDDHIFADVPSYLKSKTFEEASSQPVLLHPRPRLSITDAAPPLPRPFKHRPSIRRHLSTTFLKHANGSIRPPGLRHSASSSGRSRGAKLSLADQLWNRQSSDSRIFTASSNRPGEATPNSSVHRGGPARAASNYNRRDSRLQSFPESPLGIDQSIEAAPNFAVHSISTNTVSSINGLQNSGR
ncbi:unnamed protein product [Phytophthora lilii]|uniref:Unnamed protein product n=1 Tax=Phytophthora lilii TaxID=2077276 RepID=A0A9W6TG05_9STRA|nr:unnamed protein product [Phytophthora lilii]